MKKVVRNIAEFMNTNNAWTFIVLLAFVSTMWVMTFIHHDTMFVYQEPVKWLLTLRLFGALILLFLPVLMFALFRRRIRINTNEIVYHVLQLFIFIGYPFLLFFTDFQMNLIPVPMVSEMPTVIGVFILCTEVITSPKFLPRAINLDAWKKKVSPEWIVIALFFTLSLIQGSNSQNSGSTAFMNWLQGLVVILLLYLFYYINHYFLINKIFKKKGLFYYGFSFVGIGILFYYLIALSFRYIPVYKNAMTYVLGSEWIGENAPTAFWSLPARFIILNLLITIPLTILIQWIQQSKEIYNLEEEKNNVELNLLKQQINPHFFFNTLNNLYSMSLRKNENTSEGILQLSDLMRYVIYRGKESKVPLNEEIKYIEDYINLQKMRLYQDLDLRFETIIEDENQLITPLMLIIPIENAFKHGIEESEFNGYLHVSITQKGNSLHLSCENSFESSKDSVQKDNGLGLKNLRKRLELIYPEKHEINIIQNDKRYSFRMRIEL